MRDFFMMIDKADEAWAQKQLPVFVAVKLYLIFPPDLNTWIFLFTLAKKVEALQDVVEKHMSDHSYCSRVLQLLCRCLLKPNSITLAGSKLVADQFRTR